MEKRRSTKIPFEAKVEIRSRGTTTEGEMANVSLRGMYLQNFKSMPLGEEIEIEISLPDAPDDRTLSTKAVIVRHQDGGTGFQFGARDFDSFFVLQEIVGRISGTPGQAMTEVLPLLMTASHCSTYG
jgi:hypothetical protein